MEFVCPKCNGLRHGAERWINGHVCQCKPLTAWWTSAGTATLPVLGMMLMLSSCVGAPSVTRTSGGGYHATMGMTVLAKRQGVVAEITTREGDRIKYIVKSEDSTTVATTWMRIKLALGLAEEMAGTTRDLDAGVTARNASDNATKEVLGEQDVTVKTFVPPVE